MIDYILEISCDASLSDVVQGRLYLTESTGSSIADDGLFMIVSAYFESAEARSRAFNLVGDLDADVRQIDRRRVDWLQRYQQSLQPLFAGRSFVIAPDPSLIPNGEARHHLIIPQEQAFGTGSHESTALCIELLEGVDLRHARALDVGTGSGILALAMLRLGARRVVAFDTDLDAFRPLRENRRRNGIAPGQMPVFIGTIDALRGGRFEVIVVNILPEVIVSLLPAVKEHFGRTLIASGILVVQRDSLIEACERHGLRLESEAEKGEWWAGSFRLESRELV